MDRANSSLKLLNQLRGKTNKLCQNFVAIHSDLINCDYHLLSLWWYGLWSFFLKINIRYVKVYTLQMFAGIYRDFAGKSECGDFKFTGIACIPAIPVIFEVNQKKVWTFYTYFLLRFFKFPYNFCRNFRRTCNPCDNYMHFTGYNLRHGDPPALFMGEKFAV